MKVTAGNNVDDPVPAGSADDMTIETEIQSLVPANTQSFFAGDIFGEIYTGHIVFVGKAAGTVPGLVVAGSV